jgi:hypothetical protein
MLDAAALNATGEGSFGKVFKGRLRFSGQFVALKVGGSILTRSHAADASPALSLRRCRAGAFTFHQSSSWCAK